MRMISDILFLIYGLAALFFAFIYRLFEGIWIEWLIMTGIILSLSGFLYYYMLKIQGLTGR